MALFQSLEKMGHEQVVFCQEPTTGLKAIIAIHDTTLGPALGGCRFWNYTSEEEALHDVLRLSRGMTYKAAVSGLNLGGGKAVIIGDPTRLKSEAFFRCFGRFVDSLSGRYITAEDVNIDVKDVEAMALETKYVTGVGSGSGDPSPFTALGVYCGIKAALKYRSEDSSLSGKKVAVQGLGHVGYHLCRLLAQEGAKLVVADINESRVRRVIEEFKAEAVEIDTIHTQAVDIFAPCALGAILNDKTIPELKTQIIAGAANNQLDDEERHGKMLQKSGILYSPDYVINAGGLINVSHELRGYDAKASETETRKIFDTLYSIFTESEKNQIPCHQASNILAEKRIEAVRHSRALNQKVSNQNWIHASRK
ncbi:MAG: Glu/Leu/Phe/Val dehydrogenase [Oligoflexales bacterium]|nr:Glu/Leu/Phe/Val dehydrogenase [Oligoflexales bacterium]